MATSFTIACGEHTTKDWVGPFYPHRTKPNLNFYSQHFPAVEVDYTYYQRPRISEVKKMNEVTPDKFEFSFKLSRFMIPTRPWTQIEENVLDFLDRLGNLDNKLRWILIQFIPLNLIVFFILISLTH